MSASHRQRLDAIGFAWGRQLPLWEEGLSALTGFKAREGHCNVHHDHIEGTFKLGRWVRGQRAPKGPLSTEQVQQLNAIGFVWDPHIRAWEVGFAALKAFKEREGHCDVPMKHSEGAYKLGRWVGIQRWQSHAVTNERKQKLDEIGFNWQLTGRSGGNYARKVHASVQGTDINGFADLIFITPPEMQRSMRLLRDKILQLSSVVEKAGRSRTKPGITFTTKRNFARFEILIKWINVYLRDSKYAEDSGGLMHDVSHGTSGWGGVVKLTPDCDLEYIFTLIRASYNSTL